MEVYVPSRFGKNSNSFVRYLNFRPVDWLRARAGPDDIIRKAYAWYVRVPDVPRFLRHVVPALERRLLESPLGGYSGELRISLYRGGLRLVFEDGRLKLAESWRSPAYANSEDAAFPPLVFLQLLFGYRSLDELRYAFPDVWVKDEAELVLKTLFPMKPSWVVPIG